jgi:hypothetical protein
MENEDPVTMYSFRHNTTYDKTWKGVIERDPHLSDGHSLWEMQVRMLSDVLRTLKQL